MSNHQLEMEIIKLLIESKLSIHNQLKVIQAIKTRLDFCKKAGQEMKQQTLNFS